MAATINGFSQDEIKPQVAFQAEQNENGGWIATHEFAIQADDLFSVSDQFRKGTLLVTLDESIPQPYSQFLRISDAKFARVEGDIIIISVTATGSNTAQYSEGELGADAQPTYRLAGTLDEAPISDHPKFVALDAQERVWLGALMQGDVLLYNDELGNFREDSQEWIPVNHTLTADGLKFAIRIQEGKTTYKRPSITWTETTQGDKQLTNQQLNLLGNISVPRGNPPEAGGTRDWMLTNASSDQTGELYQTTLEWTLSERDGWDSFLYAD